MSRKFEGGAAKHRRLRTTYHTSTRLNFTGYRLRTYRGSLQPLHLPALDNGCMALTVETSNNGGEGPLSPPYWQLRLRSDSSLSSNPIAKQKRMSGTIRLEDHTEESSETYNAVWAKSVTIDDFTVVGAGVGPALGSYVVWNCTVEILNVSCMLWPHLL